MNLKIIPNPNKEIYEEVSNAVKVNDGYCPCMIEKNQDTKCICKAFREQDREGECHCGRFNKVNLTDSLSGRPICYKPNNGVYPLCIGKGDKKECKYCCLYENMEENYL